MVNMRPILNPNIMRALLLLLVAATQSSAQSCDYRVEWSFVTQGSYDVTENRSSNESWRYTRKLSATFTGAANTYFGAPRSAVAVGTYHLTDTTSQHVLACVSTGPSAPPPVETRYTIFEALDATINGTLSGTYSIHEHIKLPSGDRYVDDPFYPIGLNGAQWPSQEQSSSGATGVRCDNGPITTNESHTPPPSQGYFGGITTPTNIGPIWATDSSATVFSASVQQSLDLLTPINTTYPTEVSGNVTVTKYPMKCALSAAQDSINILPRGGTFKLAILTPCGCQWKAATVTPWIKLRSKRGVGDDWLQFTVGPSRSHRGGTIVVINLRDLQGARVVLHVAQF